MVSDDKEKGNATGFSGLSLLVSDVEDGSQAGKAAPQLIPPSSHAPIPGPAPRRAEEAPSASIVPPSFKATSGNSPDVATGKWMVGIGLGIGLLLIVLVNSTNNESARSTTTTVVQAPTTAVPAYLPKIAAPVTQGWQLAQEAGSAATESVNVLGQQIVFSNPRGYCTPGKSAREVELMELGARALGEGSRLVHAAVRCSELEDYITGRRELLDHWLQIQLIGPKGNFQRIEVPRESFLSGLSNFSPRLSPAEVNRRLKASFENSDIYLTDMKFESVGRDGNAVYFSLRMNMSVGGSSRPISGIGGITALNSLPLLINVYEGTGSPQSRAQLQAVLHELLNSLLTEN